MRPWIACFSAPGSVPLQFAGNVTVFPATVAVMVFPSDETLPRMRFANGNKNGAANLEHLVARLVVARIKSFVGIGNARRVQQVDLALCRGGTP